MRNAEAGRVNKNRSMYEADYSKSNEFVHKQQNELKKLYGGNAHITQESMNTDSYMCNDGEHAEKFSKKLTHAFDKLANPVR